MNTTKVRKQFILDPQKILKLKELVQAKTETEAIDKAMDIVLANGEIQSVLRSIKGKGKIKDVYGRSSG